MSFEWDEEKRRLNLAEHGVDFRDAALIFGESRSRPLGHVDDDYYLVAYAWRGENRRIISAWKVGEDGKKRYQALLARRT